MKLNTIKYNKEYQLTHNSKEVVRILKPKWYSSDIQCYLKNKTFLIKKVNFWGTYYNIIEMGDSIGEIKWSFKCGYILTGPKFQTFNKPGIFIKPPNTLLVII